MIKRLKEQRNAIILSAAEITLTETLTNSQWTMIENVLPILDVFDYSTLQVSSANVSASEVSVILSFTDNL